MQLVMGRRMSDQFAFLKRLHVGQAGRQADVETFDRQGSEAKEQHDKRQGDPNDPFFQLGDCHRRQLREIMIQ